MYITALVFLLLASTFFDQVSLSYFSNYFGAIRPWWILMGFGTLGLILLKFIDQIWYRIEAGGTDLVQYYGLAIFFLLIAVLIDWKIRFPVGMNVPFPQALLYYPVMAFLVEVIFHLIPLTAWLFIINHRIRSMDRTPSDWSMIACIALIEPTFQVMMDDYTWGFLILTWLNLFGFNLVQLFVFRKFGFFAMYGFRLFYYLLWHIIWGQLRLDVWF